MMGNCKTIGASCAGLALAACASTDSSETRWTRTSFSPPIVDTIGRPETLDSGIDLVSDYIEVYRKAGSANANARQFFDVPGMIAAIGGATAVALGANADVAIGTGAFSALTVAGKGYYASNERADAYFDAVAALSCIQKEAIGFDVKLTPAREAAIANKQTVSIDARAKMAVGPLTVADQKKSALANRIDELIVDQEKRAFNLLKLAAVDVEHTLQDRLSRKGSVADAKSIAALVIQYQNEIAAAQTNRDQEDDSGSDIGALMKSAGVDAPYRPNLEELSPKLDQCALIAQE